MCEFVTAHCMRWPILWLVVITTALHAMDQAVEMVLKGHQPQSFTQAKLNKVSGSWCMDTNIP